MDRCPNRKYTEQVGEKIVALPGPKEILVSVLEAGIIPALGKICDKKLPILGLFMGKISNKFVQIFRKNLDKLNLKEEIDIADIELLVEKYGKEKQLEFANRAQKITQEISEATVKQYQIIILTAIQAARLAFNLSLATAEKNILIPFFIGLIILLFIAVSTNLLFVLIF